MSKAQQQTSSSNGGYSSPRNLEHRLQMLPLASAGNVSSIMDKQLVALPALQLPAPGSKTLPASISSSSGSTKARAPTLPLAALPAPPANSSTSEAAAAQQPLPVVPYKPKPKPVETAFGYRVPSGGTTKQSSSRSASVSKCSILDSNCGSAAVTPRDDGAGGSSSNRSGSMMMGPLSLPDSRRGSNSSASGRFFEVGGSKVPLSPRAGAGQKKADAFGCNNSSTGSRSKIPKAPAKAGGTHSSSNSSSNSSSRARSHRASATQDEGETIFLDCDGGEPSHTTGGQSKPVGFTLSCAINAVFNVAGGSGGSSGSSGGMEASSLIQTMGAALSRSIMSATQQHAGSHTQQPQPVRGASRPSSPAHRRSSNSNSSSITPKQAAASPSMTRSSRGSASAGSASSGARSKAQSGGSTPSSKTLQIIPATSTFRAVGDSAGAAAASSSTASVAAGSAAQTATTIFMQLQGDMAGRQPASSRGAPSPTGSGYDSAPFYSCATSVACSEAGSDRGSIQQHQQQQLAPRSRVLKAAGPSILDPNAGQLSLSSHTTGADGDYVRYMSANTAASWTTASEMGGIVSVDETEQKPKYILAQQHQQQLNAGAAGGMLHSTTRASYEQSLLELEQSLQSLEATAAAAAAAEGVDTATKTAFAGKKAAAADAGEREVVLTITPRALPFLAARAFSQTPVRLVITQGAVWGDLAEFTAAAGEDGSSSSSAAGEGKAKKKKKGGLFSRRSSRSSKCE